MDGDIGGGVGGVGDRSIIATVPCRCLQAIDSSYSTLSWRSVSLRAMLNAVVVAVLVVVMVSDVAISS